MEDKLQLNDQVLREAGEMIVAYGPMAPIQVVANTLMESFGFQQDMARVAVVVGRSVAAGIAAIKSENEGRVDSVRDRVFATSLQLWSGDARVKSSAKTGARGIKRQSSPQSSESDDDGSGEGWVLSASGTSSEDESHQERNVRKAPESTVGGKLDEDLCDVATTAPVAEDSTNVKDLKPGEMARVTESNSQMALAAMQEKLDTFQASMSQIGATLAEAMAKKRRKKKKRHDSDRRSVSDEEGRVTNESVHGKGTPLLPELYPPQEKGSSLSPRQGADSPGSALKQAARPQSLLSRSTEGPRTLLSVAAATSVDASGCQVAPRLFVHSSQDKTRWRVSLSPSTKVLVIGDSNLKYATEVPKEWEVHSLSGAHIENIVSILKTFPPDSGLNVVIMQAGINHRDDLRFPIEAVNELEYEAKRINAKLMIVGIPIAVGMSKALTRKLKDFNKAMYDVFLTRFIYPLKPIDVYMERDDPSCIHFRPRTVLKMIDCVIDRMLKTRILSFDPRQRRDEREAARPSYDSWYSPPRRWK